MNIIADFITSIGEDKTNIVHSEFDSEDVQAIVKNNCAHMKNCYIKLRLFIEYGFTDIEGIKSSLDNIFKKYYKVFDLLGDSIFEDRRAIAFEKVNPKISDDSARKSAKYISEYRCLLDNKDVDEHFWNELTRFINNETNYIKYGRGQESYAVREWKRCWRQVFGNKVC